ncbi:carboxypeptidase regulatory-like domain-containing protein [Hyalangium rubrum]|uniref:Carboxypeptidase regulatory-like domain-containing protein n=1 Tax=Hyalangium rubrum TaxID=3103134 RepID=A0ABU5H1M9_9BACT|nr:carboxypeptidase regulatory-like domain-containing protein [Hyalangium sp. s54d21]MDY7227360.1 carboxypeptidase regulatory-like domain-containing protein [Hyalangium sp. s54d21]
MKRRALVLGAVLVALAAGLWFLLGDSPAAESSQKESATSNAAPSPPRVKRGPPPRREEPPRAPTPEPSAEALPAAALEAEEELLGYVVSKRTGEPVALAEVILTPLAEQSESEEPLEVPEEEKLFTTSSETGEFFFTGLTPGRYHIEVRASGFVTKVLPSLPVPFGGRVTLDLGMGGHLEGQVLGVDGQPSVGAEVLAFSGRQEARARTDAQGGFTLEVPTGTYAISAHQGAHAGELEREVTVAEQQRVQGLRIYLGEGARVSGTVLHEDGTPLLGARVQAHSRQALATSGVAGTDERGAFSIAPLAASTYDLRVLVPTGDRLEHKGLSLSPGEHATVTFTYQPRGTLTVWVSGKKRDAAEPLVKVSALPAPGRLTGGDVQGVWHRWDGWKFEGLLPGRYRVEARRAPDQPAVEQSVHVSERPQRVLLLLPAEEAEDEPSTFTVEGRVVTRSGGLPDAPVRVTVHRIVGVGRSREFDADEQGHFRIELHRGLVRPLVHELTTRMPRRLGCETNGKLRITTEQNQEVTIVLETRAPELRLQVQDAEGRPFPNAPVMVNFEHSRVVGETDALGRLEVCFPPTTPPRFPLMIQALHARLAAVVEYARGEWTPVRLQPSLTVRGRVVSGSGAPVRRFGVAFFSEGLPRSGVEQDFTGDRFELREVPLGRSKLQVVDQEGRGATVSLDLRPGADVNLEILVSAGVPLEGRVVDATTRQPLEEVAVSLSATHHTVTRKDGRFRFRNVLPGEYLLQLSRRVRGGVTHPVQLMPGEALDLGDLPFAAQ